MEGSVKKTEKTDVMVSADNMVTPMRNTFRISTPLSRKVQFLTPKNFMESESPALPKESSHKPVWQGPRHLAMDEYPSPTTPFNSPDRDGYSAHGMSMSPNNSDTEGDTEIPSSQSSVLGRKQYLQVKQNDYKFPPLSTAVIKKIQGHGHNKSLPMQAILPPANTRWFFWWVFNHPALLSARNAVDKCVADARLDNVLPHDIEEHPKITNLQSFVQQKLRNTRKYIKKELEKQ